MKRYYTSFSTVTLFGLLLFSCVAYLANAQEPETTESTPEVMSDTDETNGSPSTATGTTTTAEFETSTLSNPNLDPSSQSDQSNVAATNRAPQRDTVRQVGQIALNLRQQERFINLASNVANRMDATVARLNNINGRLEQRIVLIKEAGQNTTDAEAQLQQAQTSLADAEELLVTIDTDISNFVSDNEPYAAWQVLKMNFTRIRDVIIDAHKQFTVAVELLRATTTE